jgi:hypothetical protein
MPASRLTPPRTARPGFARVLLRFAGCPAAALVLAAAAHAAPPAPLSIPAFAFPLPGDYVAAANARSAGLALSDRWLGTTAFENPAAAVPQGIELSPLFQRVSRQDLSSENRDFDQTTGFLDGAGGALSLPTGSWGFVLYAWQPVLRLEEQGYSAGPLVAPAAVQQQDNQRELRAGAAISRGFGALRFGVSGEWVHRDDSYETHEQSGDPSAGDRVLTFSGDGVGVTAGMTYQKEPDQPWGRWIGAAVRFGSELPVTGTLDQRLTVGDTTFDFDATRASEWSGGVSARVLVAPATRVVAGISARSGAKWDGFGFETTGGASWSLGLDWKDDELPWGARFGVGQEANPGALEKRAGLVAVGFTYVMGSDLVFDLGLLHRNLTRGDFPHSSDDRVVGSVRVAF